MSVHHGKLKNPMAREVRTAAKFLAKLAAELAAASDEVASEVVVLRFPLNVGVIWDGLHGRNFRRLKSA